MRQIHSECNFLYYSVSNFRKQMHCNNEMAASQKNIIIIILYTFFNVQFFRRTFGDVHRKEEKFVIEWELHYVIQLSNALDCWHRGSPKVRKYYKYRIMQTMCIIIRYRYISELCKLKSYKRTSWSEITFLTFFPIDQTCTIYVVQGINYSF